MTNVAETTTARPLDSAHEATRIETRAKEAIEKIDEVKVKLARMLREELGRTSDADDTEYAAMVYTDVFTLLAQIHDLVECTYAPSLSELDDFAAEYGITLESQDEAVQ